MKLRLFLTGIALFILQLSSAQLAQPFSVKSRLGKVSSEHVEVYAYEEDLDAANRVARMAEQARYELGILFDYRPVGTYKLFYFPSAQALLHSNIDWGPSEEVEGRIEFPEGQALIVHPGSSQGLYQEVRKAMAEVILEEFANGTLFNTILQKELLLYDAQWFFEGLVEYAGSGWTYEDERKIAGAYKEDLVALAIEGDGELSRLLRKSIWHYIVHEYGEQKISEIVYLVNISHSIESGIISVLGITLNTLTLRWERYIKNRIKNLLVNRLKLEDYGPYTDIPLQDKQRVLAARYHGDSNRVALYLDREGQQSVQIYDIGEKSWTTTPIKSGFKHQNAQLLDFQATLEWHPNQALIYAPVWTKGQYKLAMYDLVENELTMRDLPRDVRKIYTISISHDGNRLLFSALHKGSIDIYTGPSKEGSFKQITNDGYDNLDPIWSDDDQSIFFSSNRKEIGKSSFEEQLYGYENHFDIFQIIMTRDTALWARISSTPFIDERQPQVTSHYELWYLSDRSGVSNLEEIDISSHKASALTNLSVGIGSLHLYNNFALLTHYKGKKAELLLMRRSSLGENKFPEPTLRRLENDSKRKIEEQKEEKRKEKLEKIRRQEEEDVKKAKEDKKKKEEEAEKKEKQPVRYYIFDDDDEPYEVKKADKDDFLTQPKPQSKAPTTVFGRVDKPELGDVEVSRPTYGENPWRTLYTGLNIHYDPISTLGLKFDAGFQDLAQNHELKATWIPFIRLRIAPRDHIIRADYAYKKNKIDLIGEAGLTTRFLWIQDVSTSLDSLIFRYNKVFANVGARYPLSAKSFMEAKAGILRLDRLDQRLTRLVLLNDRDNLLRGGLKAEYDNTVKKDGFTLEGFKAQAQADYFYSLNNSQEAFYRAKARINYYRPIFDNMVLSLQVSGGFSSARFVPQYYLGGVPGQLHNPVVFQRRDENRVRDNSVDTSLYALHFAEFLTPMRGFGYNTRSGSRYMIANLELRIPISKLLRYSLQPNSLYNVELIPFIDAGTVWTEGNPFSQRKPTDTQFITSGNVTIKLQTLKSPFLIGIGTGLRVNLLNWSARFDLAWGLDDYILQRPQLTTSLVRNF